MFDIRQAVFLPLQGPDGIKSKAPAVGAWQSPGYTGLSEIEAEHQHYLDDSQWFGLRTDDLVVIDCDSLDAAWAWAEHDSGSEKTWVRKTPRGYHYIYLRTPGSPDAPAVGVWPGIDIRAGRTSQIVFYAPGYHDVTDRLPRVFDPKWLPEAYGSPVVHEGESWDEIPDGRGNNTMTAFAGAFRKQGMSPLRIAKCLGAINRIVMTEDPMPIEMIVQIALSVSRYAPRPDIDIEVEA